MFPLVPALVPVHPLQALPPASNIWTYDIPIQRDPVAPDPYTVPDNSYLYSRELKALFCYKIKCFQRVFWVEMCKHEYNLFVF